jgi:phosphohistidine swiveling domain-containing protein
MTTEQIQLRPASGWAIWGQAAAPLYLCMTLRAGMEYTRHVFGSPIWASAILFEDNQAKWLYRPAELKQLGQRVIDFLVNQRLRSAFLASCDQAEAQLLAAVEDQKTHASWAATADAVAAFQSLEELYCRWYGYVWACEPVQFRTQEILEPKISALAESKGFETAEVLAALYSLPDESFTTEITRDLLECATALDDLAEANSTVRDLLDKRPASVEFAEELIQAVRDSDTQQGRVLLQRLELHAERYGWKRNNYLGGAPLTAADILVELLAHSPQSPAGTDFGGKLRQELAGVTARKTALLSLRTELLPQLDSYERLIANVGATFGAQLLDQRKKTIMISNGAFESLIRYIATALDRPLADLRFLLAAELSEYAANPEPYTERLTDRRNRFLVYQSDTPILEELTYGIPSNGVPDFARVRMPDPYLAEGSHLIPTFLRLNARFGMTTTERDSEDASTLRGVVAHRPSEMPTIGGTVAVVLNAREDHIEEGQILVAPSTTPDYISAIRKAKAIITEWGGQTSHAAVTARELNKPCIIGTGFATSQLKSGMQVELDLRSGIISVIGSEK